MKKHVHATTSPAMAFASSELGQRLLALQASGSDTQRRIAVHLLRNPVRAAAVGIEDLAQVIGVSPATLSRFTRTLGYAGFADLRAAIAGTMQAMLQPVEKLRDSFSRAGADGELLAECLESAMSSARQAADGLSPGILGRARDLMAGARTVFVMGFGLSSHVAGLLTLGLQPFLPNVTNVVEFGGTEVAAGRLMGIGPEDVLIAISFPRYARDAVHLASYARDRDARLVAITDSIASPLMPLADVALLAPGDHPVLSTPVTAAVLIAEALVSAIMIANPDSVERATALTDAIAGYLVNGEGR